MKNQEWHSSLSLHVCYAAVLTIAVGQDIVYYKCKDFPVMDTSQFNISCDAGKIIIVKSAVIGATDVLNPPQQCPITINTCLKETTLVAELCTGRNSCVINQNYVFNESQILCVQSNNRFGNFININYTCIVPVHNNYGDICHFDEDVYSNSAVYLSSFPNFPEVMGPDASYQCSCLFTSKPTSLSANVTIRTLLVKLTGARDTCSERLSIIDSKDENKLEFCSPCSSANNLATISLASNTSATVMSFRRDQNVSPFNGKFILEITVSSESSGVSSVGSMKCGYVGSTIYSSTSVNSMSSSSTSTTTTSALLSQPNSLSSTNVQNTSSGATLGSSIMATNAEQSTLSSSKSAAETRSSSTEIPTGDATPTLASKTDSEKNAISTGGIVGIVLGSAGFIAIVITALLCLLIRIRKQYRNLSKENTNFNIQPSDTFMQNMRVTNSIDSHDANSSELYTFQSTAHFSNEPQTRGYESKSHTEDNSMSNYEEGAPVSVATYGPGMIQTDEQKRLRNEIADDLTNETQSMNSGDGDVTLVENQLYVGNANSVTDAVVSDDYDVARPVSNGYDVARPVSNDYDVARPVLQDGGKDKSAEVNRAYAVVQPMTNSVDHSYYNVPTSITTYQSVDHSYDNVPARTGNGTVQSPAEVSAEAGASSAPDEGAATNPVYKADSDVLLIDNTLYGSMLGF